MSTAAQAAESATHTPPMDAHAFARMFAVEAPRVFRVLRRLGVRDSDLEDVCQEVFLVVYRRQHEFRGDASLRTWIYGIALRKAIAHRRRKDVRDVRPLPEGDLGIPPDQQLALERGQARTMLQAALDKLGSGQRDVFVLYELEELSMREVAALLELPLHTAYSRLYAARAEMAAQLRRSGQGGSR